MLYIFLLVLIGIIFHTWFTFLPISAGDWGFFYKEQILEYFNPPYMWETFRNLGFGGSSFISQGVYWYNLLLGILGRYFDYGIIERIIWFFPILLVGFISPLILGKVLNLFPKKFYPIIAFLYIVNTYFLMIMGGGQLTVVLGYITIPLAFALFISTIKRMTFFKVGFFSFIFSFLFAFDFRLTFIFLFIIFFYTIFSLIYVTSVKDIVVLGKKYIVIFISVFIVTIGIHAFWILPFAVHFYNPVLTFDKAYITSDAVRYFSFAQFENVFSLLHPYWPENIFGKVGFMKPEFLLLPILAYASLLFVERKKEYMLIVFFAFLGLLGVFLAKGANEPFGEVYVLLFTRIPGFVMLRDPTKWYVLVTLSYSILIPYNIYKSYEWLKSHKKFSIKSQIYNSQNIFLIFIISYLLFLIHPAILGELGGTLKTIEVPREYIDYKTFILKDNNFSRVLWIPTLQRFTFYSNTHPAISGRDFFDDYKQYGIISHLQKEFTKELLRQSSVKYLVVPDDTQQEIFIKDRKYDETQYKEIVKKLQKIPWLREAYRFGNIVVFELDNPKEHFWTTSSETQLNAKLINPAEYQLEVKNAKIGDKIIFAESYDGGWYMENGIHGAYDASYNKYFNSFILQKSGDYMTRVTYKPQSLVTLGLTITSITFLATIGLLGVLLVRERKI